MDTERFAILGERIDSPFFTADNTFLADGRRWVETNDGEVSSLPEPLDPRELHRAIAKR